MRKRAERMRKLLAAMCVAAVCCVTGCAKEEQVIPELREPAGVQADMAEAFVGEICSMSVYSGAVAAYVEELAFPVDGQVKTVPAYAGKWVEEGDVLVELDRTAERERAEELRRTLEYTEKDNALTDELAELEIERLQTELKRLRETGASKTQIDLKRMDIREKQTQLRQTQELRLPELEAQRRELQNLEEAIRENCLYAPFAGRVIYCGLKAGDAVSAFKPAVYLADNDRLFISSAYVSQSVLEDADRIYALVGADEYEIVPRPVDQGEYISQILSGNEVKSYYDVTGPAEKLSSLECGQYAAICVVSDSVQEALLVPSGAIYRDAEGKYVYVDEEGAQKRREVKTGASNDVYVQITEGLAEGESVYVR